MKIEITPGLAWGGGEILAENSIRIGEITMEKPQRIDEYIVAQPNGDLFVVVCLPWHSTPSSPNDDIWDGAIVSYLTSVLGKGLYVGAQHQFLGQILLVNILLLVEAL